MSSKLLPSICIDAVFGNLSIDAACQEVVKANVSSIEFWSWWDKDLAALQDAVSRYDLSIACCCTRFISLVDPKLREQYLQGLAESIAIAQRLNVKTLISQVGDFIQGVPRAQQKQSLIDGLSAAAPLLEDSGITLVVEPLNELVDHQGYFLVNSDEAFDIIRQVSSPNIKVLFDIYHQQISEGHVISNILANIDYIGHFHAAGNPGRNELQFGEINYPQVFLAIKETSYKGYVGLEYWPKTDDPIIALREVSDWLD
ncbi:TIM barrel protein [Paraglaciecola aquimarina]|uniref:TIM barrel protein n=1 Tax=Paraglaciecola aquimarina TaxID=1235557 RepID=A0ABU3SZJ8_9ALTE|nr:TIM barrel protein [Paraglaciecola aquimarina]MDU0355418.1 TIM barrel protein [Paraglaciecola aquimarina]